MKVIRAALFGVITLFFLTGCATLPYSAEKKAPLLAKGQKLVLAKPVLIEDCVLIPALYMGIYMAVYNNIKDAVYKENTKQIEDSEKRIVDILGNVTGGDVSVVPFSLADDTRTTLTTLGYTQDVMNSLSASAKTLASEQKADQVVLIVHHKTVGNYGLFGIGAAVWVQTKVLVFDKTGLLIGNGDTYAASKGEVGARITADDVKAHSTIMKTPLKYVRDLLPVLYGVVIQNPPPIDFDIKKEHAKVENREPSTKVISDGIDLSKTALGDLPTFKTGEWSVYRNIVNGKFEGIVKLGIVSADEDAVVYELAYTSESGLIVLQFTVEDLDQTIKSGDKGKTLIQSAKYVLAPAGSNDRRVSNLDGVGRDVFSKLLDVFSDYPAINNPIVAQGSTTVPAGIFQNTWKASSLIVTPRYYENATGYLHSRVPINHIVKSVSEDGKSVMELVDFGYSGYESLIKTGYEALNK